MAPVKDQDAARKQKEAKQKKVLAGLIVVLIGVVAIMGPGMLDRVRGEEQPAGEPSAEGADPGDGGEPTPIPDLVNPLDPSVGSLTVSAELPNSDIPPPPDEGQLISFGRFTAADPFDQLLEFEVPEESPEEPSDPGDPSPPPPDDGGGDSGPSDPVDFEVPDMAVLTVNDVEEAVGVGGAFPIDDPIFELASISGETAMIGLVTGSFSTGIPTVDLKVGETLTLISQPDGVRYEIKLIRVYAGGGTTEFEEPPDESPEESPEAPEE